MRRAGWRLRSFGAVTVAALLLGGCWVDRGSPPGVTDARAVDVNAGGLILVGSSAGAFVMQPNNEWLAIGTLDEQATVTPEAIDDAGTVVGNTFGTDPFGVPTRTPFVWDSEAGIRALETVTGEVHETVSDISDSGHIVGTDGPTTGWLWHSDMGQGIELSPLPGYTSSLATAVNDGGWVVGESRWGSEPDTSTLWKPPDYTPIPLDRADAGASNVVDIDDNGTMVGYLTSFDGQGGAESRAVVWSADGAHEVSYLEEDPDPNKIQFHNAAVAIDDGLIIGWENGVILGSPIGPFNWQVAWDADTLARTELYQPPANHPDFQAIDGNHLVGTLYVSGEGGFEHHIVSRGRPPL